MIAELFAPLVRRPWDVSVAALLLFAGTPTLAQNAETVEGLGPSNGDWDFE